MACYHPLKGFKVGYTDNGKDKYMITSYDVHHVEKVHGKPAQACYTKEVSPYITYLDDIYFDWIEIPCGKCIGCRLAYSRMWADRCMAEATLHDSNWFITLTYDDLHLPHSNICDLETGEFPFPTLRKRDFQLFMKRLRKNYEDEEKIRFFSAGEYGSKTARPHYHALLFGLKLDDLQLYKKTPLGFNLYTSEFVNKAWQYQGHVIIAEVTWETCAYTARYIMKKQSDTAPTVAYASKLKQIGIGATIYDELGIEPEFTLMSRKPGIAREFYEQHKLDFIRYGESNISTPKGGKKIHNTKYFNKFLEIEYPEEYNVNKKTKIKQMEVIKARKLQQTSVSYMEMLQTEENVKKTRIKSLERKEI